MTERHLSEKVEKLSLEVPTVAESVPTYYPDFKSGSDHPISDAMEKWVKAGSPRKKTVSFTSRRSVKSKRESLERLCKARRRRRRVLRAENECTVAEVKFVKDMIRSAQKTRSERTAECSKKLRKRFPEDF